MITEAVAPFQLHRGLEGAKDASAEDRKSILTSTLQSQNLAVIRRIPELLAPLSDEEKMDVVRWAEKATRQKTKGVAVYPREHFTESDYANSLSFLWDDDGPIHEEMKREARQHQQQHRKDDDDVSTRDFAFHLMVACEVPAEQILDLLERNKTFSRHALEHIQQMLQQSDAVGQLDGYLREVAETLLKEERVPSRDRGRHMLMTLAKTEDEWLALAERFSTTEISDLRQKVLERFVQECNEEVIALPLFVENVVVMCLEKIRKVPDLSFDVHDVASHMHWVITCLERTDDQKRLTNAAVLFRSKFDKFLPHSVSGRIGKYLPKQQMKPQKPSVSIFDSIEKLVKDGWTIRKENSKQVVLVKDGKSVTKYRS